MHNPSINIKFTLCYVGQLFFLIAVIAATLGFGGVAAGAAGIAKISFYIFLVMFVLSFIVGKRSVEKDISL